MIRIAGLLLCSTAAVIALGSCATTGVTSRAPQSDSFQIRAHQKQVLANGLTVLWIPDASLPYVALQMMVKSGSSADPKGREGLAAMTADMLKKGTKLRTANQIDDDLEQIGTTFSSNVEPDYTTLSLSALSFHKEEALGHFSEIFLSPIFPAAELNRHRQIILGSLQKMADQPQSFASYVFQGFLFGAHPYGHDSVGTPTALRRLQVADLKAYYNRHYVPSNAVLAVVGQFDANWKAQVARTFESWSAKAEPAAELPAVPTWTGLESMVVDRKDLNQAQIQIGFRGVPRDIPEYLELRAALKILGESFGSRLFEEIRVKRGLTYGIYAWFDPRQLPGPMGITTFTRNDKIGETIEETLNTYRLFVAQGVTQDEVAEVRNLMKGQFPRMFETSEALARQLLILDRYGIGVDYLTEYMKNVDGLSKASIDSTIRKYFDPTNLRILVYAPKDQAEPVLKKFGKVQVRSYQEFIR